VNNIPPAIKTIIDDNIVFNLVSGFLIPEKKKTGKNKKNNTTKEVNQRIVAPGQCNILNKVEMQKSIPKSTPNPNKNLSFTTFTSFVLTIKYIGKKIKLIIKIENNKTTFAPGK
jgi:hypothetical protein